MKNKERDSGRVGRSAFPNEKQKEKLRVQAG